MFPNKIQNSTEYLIIPLPSASLANFLVEVKFAVLIGFPSFYQDFSSPKPEHSSGFCVIIRGRGPRRATETIDTYRRRKAAEGERSDTYAL